MSLHEQLKAITSGNAQGTYECPWCGGMLVPLPRVSVFAICTICTGINVENNGARRQLTASDMPELRIRESENGQSAKDRAEKLWRKVCPND